MKKVKTLSKKLVCTLLILITILPSLMQTVSLATEINEAYLQDRGDCGLHLQYWTGSSWNYVTTTYVTYNQNGVEYPAYCLNREFPGVGEHDAYTVDINSVLDDARIWRVIKNGYPYRDMGLNQYDSFVATKQAVYCILYGFDPATRYRGGDDRGTAIANKICELVNIGRNGTETPASAGVNVNKSGELKEEGNTYYQIFTVNAAVETSQYTITSSAGLPNGSKITDLSGNEKNTFSGGEKFKVVIPKTSITSDVNATFAVQAKCKTYPIFYGRTRIPGTQNYAVTFDPFRRFSRYSNIKY